MPRRDGSIYTKISIYNNKIDNIYLFIYYIIYWYVIGVIGATAFLDGGIYFMVHSIKNILFRALKWMCVLLYKKSVASVALVTKIKNAAIDIDAPSQVAVTCFSWRQVTPVDNEV